MWDSRLDNVSGSERKGSHVLCVLLEFLNDGVLADGEDLCINEFSIVQEVLDVHFVLKRSDLQLIEQGSLRWSNLVTFLDNSNGIDNFNLGFDNLGLDAKSLEETSLLWIKASWTWRNNDAIRGN
jgi:hypothetical protein